MFDQSLTPIFGAPAVARLALWIFLIGKLIYGTSVLSYRRSWGLKLVMVKKGLRPRMRALTGASNGELRARVSLHADIVCTCVAQLHYGNSSTDRLSA